MPPVQVQPEMSDADRALGERMVHVITHAVGGDQQFDGWFKGLISEAEQKAHPPVKASTVGMLTCMYEDVGPTRVREVVNDPQWPGQFQEWMNSILQRRREYVAGRIRERLPNVSPMEAQVAVAYLLGLGV